MQGRKTLQPKLFNSFNLADRIPENNFYRKRKSVLDLDFLYITTKPYYGSCGQKSIDPTVFFRLCLVGYLENIISDRQLIRHASMRLDIVYFLDYDIDDALPWHSTISRTRDMFADVLFAELFERVLILCVNKGMVSGKSQAIDSAPVKANASMESLELKVPEEELDDHLRKVRARILIFCAKFLLDPSLDSPNIQKASPKQMATVCAFETLVVENSMSIGIAVNANPNPKKDRSMDNNLS